MKKSIKAALLSALVFPGVGHFSLKLYPRGILFFVPAMASLIFQVYYVLTQATAILAQMESSSAPFDIAMLSNLAADTGNASQLFLMNFSSWILLVCWLAGILDAYQLGRTQETTTPPGNRRK